jgi:outer membrane receptor protein involved in Fe transport
MNPTIQPPRLLALRALLTALFAGSALAAAAQSVPRPPPPSTAQDELITLSPFSVSTDRDNGFVAASSLAGGRLATDLKDTPVAYSVLTRDFIDALGITNQFDASDWAPNSVKSIAGNGGGYGDDVSNAPGTYNVRGAGGGRAQRNFFIFFSPNDSYVVERFDFGRGPNAILFGNGGLGGVSTVTTKQARFGNNFTEIAQTFGSWNNSRTTLDVNRALNDRLAVRTAAVYTDADGWRDKQFEKSPRRLPHRELQTHAQHHAPRRGRIRREQAQPNVHQSHRPAQRLEWQDGLLRPRRRSQQSHQRAELAVGRRRPPDHQRQSPRHHAPRRRLPASTIPSPASRP